MAFEFTLAKPPEIPEDNFKKNITFIETIKISDTSKVYLAKDNGDKQLYVYKANDIYLPSDIERFSKEYELGRYLTQKQKDAKKENLDAMEYIIKVYNHFIVIHKDFAGREYNGNTYKSTHYIKMEYVPDSAGFDVLIPCIANMKHQYDIKKAEPIFRQLFDIVNFIHSAGVLHNGIMPDNIIFNSKTVKISMLDFKYSCILSPKMVAEPLRKMYSCQPTENFMFTAPEILKNKNYFGEISDIDILKQTDNYSLGSVLYCLFNNGKLPTGLIYGEKPEKPDIAKLFEKHIPSDTGEEQFDRVLDGLTDFDPEKRIGLAKASRMLKKYVSWEEE